VWERRGSRDMVRDNSVSVGMYKVEGPSVHWVGVYVCVEAG
jgi:hypothetical protein